MDSGITDEQCGTILNTVSVAVGYPPGEGVWSRAAVDRCRKVLEDVGLVNADRINRILILSQAIREIDGDHTMGSDELAEALVNRGF